MTAETKHPLDTDHPAAGIGRIGAADYRAHEGDIPHIFLTGALQTPTPYPYFEDHRVELIHCTYAAGDHGPPHWHRDITEYQIVLSGEVRFRTAPGGDIVKFGPGDVSSIPAQVCVERVIDVDTTTVALKVPSIPGDKVHCDRCARRCAMRRAEYEG